MTSTFDRYQRIARLYDFLDLPFECGRYRRIRPLLFAGLSGRILDAGVGTGRNIPFYPPDAHVVGIDLSPAMLAQARRRARALGRRVELDEMDVTRLGFSDQSFDAAVGSFLFCVLPDDLQVPALREIKRVLKPDGVLRLLEYVRPKGRLRRQWLVFGSPGWHGLTGLGSTAEPKSTLSKAAWKSSSRASSWRT